MNMISTGVANAAITITACLPPMFATITQDATEVRHVRAETYRYVNWSTGEPSVASTKVSEQPKFVPKTELARRLYAIRQREIAAGRLVLRDAQEILDEIEASRA